MTSSNSGARRLKLPTRPEAIEFDPSATALIVVDMQNAYLSKGGYLDLAGFDLSGADAVIATTAKLIARLREAGMPIIFLQNGWDPAYVEAGGPDSPNQAKSNALKVMRKRPELNSQLLAKGGWDYALHDDMRREPGDLLIQKSRYSGFINTPLDSMLRSRGVTHVLVAGVASNVCVETTIRDAFGLEYHAIMVTDCCLQAGPRALHDATIFNVETFFGWTTTSEQIEAGLDAL